jgi:hypothetical protein
MVARLCALWHGDATSPDDAITQHAYATHLHRALREHHHLADTTEPTPPPQSQTPASGGRRPDPASRNTRIRRTSPGRPSTPSTQRGDPEPRQQPSPAQRPWVVPSPEHPNRPGPQPHL